MLQKHLCVNGSDIAVKQELSLCLTGTSNTVENLLVKFRGIDWNLKASVVEKSTFFTIENINKGKY